jgi:predicted branched-subunit amino acid permease
VLWNVAMLAGALAGESLGDPRSLGLDAAVAAAFLALLWPRLATSRARLVAAGAAALALGVTPYVAAGVPVLAAALVAVAGGVRE